MEILRRTRVLLADVSPSKALIYSFLLIGAWGIAFATHRFGLIAGILIGAIPGALCMLYWCVKRPVVALFALFIVNYFIMEVGRYLHDMPVGLLLDAMVFYNLFILILHGIYRKVEWQKASSWLTLLTVIWLVYAILQAFNPQSISISGWFSSVRLLAFHFFLIVVLTQILMDDLKYLRYMLYIWSILTLIAVAKALYQKYIGFTGTEIYWLYVLGHYTTHIIHSGVRYFSIFSDAANFGGGMGFSMVVFSTAALCLRSKPLKLYFLFVAIAACYGMLISGTRSALAVPFVGYALYIFMSKRIKIIIPGILLVVSMFVFLNFTHIGHGNAIIRRARSAFNSDDPSLIVRLENQSKLQEIMDDKPFGAGLGHGGGKAKVFAPDAPLSQIPTDSWFVMIWVEMGIVGIILHALILASIIGFGAFQVMFRLKNEQVRGLTASLTAGIMGLIAMSYANEILGQIPTGAIVYMSMAFIAMAPHFDKRLTEAQPTKLVRQ